MNQCLLRYCKSCLKCVISCTTLCSEFHSAEFSLWVLWILLSLHLTSLHPFPKTSVTKVLGNFALISNTEISSSLGKIYMTRTMSYPLPTRTPYHLIPPQELWISATELRTHFINSRLWQRHWAIRLCQALSSWEVQHINTAQFERFKEFSLSYKKSGE